MKKRAVFLVLLVISFSFVSAAPIKIEEVKSIDSYNYCNNLLGDLNNDDEINVLDVVLMVDVILGILEFDDCQDLISDINQDGGLSVLDVVGLVSLTMGRDADITRHVYALNHVVDIDGTGNIKYLHADNQKPDYLFLREYI